MTLEPQIVAKLEAFARRRRKLIIVRGVCTAVALLLATMMVVALVDWLFVLPDAARWTMSAAAYLAVLLAEWRTCLRLLAHAPGPRRLARLIEHAEPRLREDLLSAVELGTANETEIFDSTRFRELVQNDVASRVAGIDVDRLLPVQLVRRYLTVAAVIVAALLVAFALTGMQAGTLLIRAFLPMANLARVSQYKVAILQPADPEPVVPHGELVSIVIQVSGGKTNKAVLETFSVHGGREVLPMTPLGADKFSATIQVAREDVRYRIRAGDAITRKFQLDAEPRPHVAKFHKRYIYPDYVRNPPKDVSEETGDLVALEGSAVEIGVETSLPVKSGELRIEQGLNSEIIPLVVTPIKQGDPTTRLTAKLPLRASGTYRVHLVAARTAFENKFSPEYEIRVDPDLVPQVELELPERDLIAPANEIIDLHATATDDQSLAGVSQFVRINEENWKETVLATDSGERIKIERRWDIFEEGVKPGDLLTFKLQATDSKGNKAESRSLQITVTQSGFELTRIEALGMQRTVHEALRQLRVAGEALGKQAAELGNQFPQLGESDSRRPQLISMTVNAQTAFEQVAEEAWKVLGSAIPVSSAGHAAADLVLTGRMIARTNQGSAHPARDILDILQAHPDAANARDDAREYAGAAGRVVGRAALVEQAYRTFLAAEELDVANEIINVLSAEHERLATLAANSGMDQERWRPLLKRLRVVTAECRTLEKLLSTAAPHMTGGYGDRMRRLQRKLEQSRALLDEALKRAESEKPASEAFGKLSKIAQQTGRDLLALRRDLLVMKREMLPEAVQTVNHLFAEVQPTHTHLDKLQQDLRMNARNEKLSGEARANLERRRWETRIAMGKAHGDLEELRPVSDSHFVNDLRSVTLALHALQAASAGLGLDRVDEKLRALEKPLRLLENAHNISELADGAQHLLAAERWELFSPHARTANPRDWEWIEGRMKVVAEELGNTGLEPPARELLREAQKRLREAIADPTARAVNEEMKQRLHPEREPRAVPDDVEHVALLLQQALDVLRKPMEEARAEIAAATPRLEEVMAQLARESETLKEETSAQAARTKEQPLDQAQSAAEQMLARQESLNEKVDTLKDALRSEANKHDILDQQARELARDVDDALALLKDPPQRAATALEEAAQTAQAEARQNHLHAAAVEQQKLAESLQQLSEHFAHAEQPNAQQTRTALRETESMTGVKEKLDAQYARAEQLAQMARSSPQELLAQLEKALPENPAMQRELDSISENLLASARQQLAQASQQEKQIADDVGKLAAEQQAQIDALSFQPSAPAPSSQPPAPSGNPAPSNPTASQNPPSTPPAGGLPEATNAPPAPANGSVPPPSPARSAQLAKAAAQQAPIAAQANRAGEEVARAGRHEMRLNNTTAGGKLAQLGDEISETAKTEVPAAAKALANGSSAVQAAPAVSAANTELARELGALQTAAAAGQESADPSQRGSAAQPSSPAPPSPSSSPSTNPPASGQAPGTSAQSPPAAPAQKGAPNAPSPGSPGAPGEAAAPQPGSPGGTGTPQGTPSQLAATPATQQEQVWMARTLDALDAMLNATPSASQANASQNGQQPSGAPAGSPPPGSSAVSQAISAMNAAARSAAAAMRGPGLGDGPGEQPRSEDKVKSTAGAQIEGKHLPYAALPGAKEGKTEEWGKLPKKVAEELSQGQRENVAGEYRNQVETYYRVIAEKSRQ